jgi:uncharacterized protein with PIN domain
MPAKTKKDFQVENSGLKEELSDVKSKYATLSEKYENLLGKLTSENVLNHESLRCEKCDNTFANRREFKKHNSIHRSNKEIFHCDQCEKHFDEEWKMKAQMQLMQQSFQM